MWHAPSSELVIRFVIEHSCTVLYEMERMTSWLSESWVCPCSTRVAGASEFRGTRAHASRFPTLRRVKHDHPSPWRASRSQHRDLMFSFSYSRLEKQFIFAIMCYAAITTKNIYTTCCTAAVKFNSKQVPPSSALGFFPRSHDEDVLCP
jgi:hypothetical protein